MGPHRGFRCGSGRRAAPIRSGAGATARAPCEDLQRVCTQHHQCPALLKAHAQQITPVTRRPRLSRLSRLIPRLTRLTRLARLGPKNLRCPLLDLHDHVLGAVPLIGHRHALGGGLRRGAHAWLRPLEASHAEAAWLGLGLG